MTITAETGDYRSREGEIRLIRDEVFVKEQGVPAELEFDGLDAQARHVLVRVDGAAAGTGRIFIDGHIGRVAVRQCFRRQGIGRLIMEKLIDYAIQERMEKVWLAAQKDAVEFYRKSGFKSEGEVFLEAGIEHIRMHKSLTDGTSLVSK